MNKATKYINMNFVVVILIMFLAQALEPLSSEWLGFYSDKIVNGEFWRLITGQLLHTNLPHLLLNIAGLILISLLHSQYYSTKDFIFILLISLGFIGVGILLITSYSHYAGLSGVLHSFMVYGALQDIKHQLYTGWILLLAIFVKVFNEVIFGASEYTETLINASVALEAHLLGVIVGISLFILNLYKKEI